MTISSDIQILTTHFQRNEAVYNKREWLNKQNPMIESTVTPRLTSGPANKFFG